MFAQLRVAWKQAAVSGPAAKLDIFLVCIFHNILSCPVWIELKAETSEQFCVTFPANREVFHHTVSIFIHHVSKILHRGDGVITNTVQNDAWKNRNNNISFIQQPLSRKSWSCSGKISLKFVESNRSAKVFLTCWVRSLLGLLLLLFSVLLQGLLPQGRRHVFTAQLWKNHNSRKNQNTEQMH